MARDPRAFLWDALSSAGHIQRFVEHRSLEDYVGERMLRSAVEREFEVIGEALNQLARVAPEMAARISDCRRIIAFRNLLIHGYASVRNERVWHIVHEDLPRLRREVDELLVELNDPS
jgi:uncharacterized protein with HEPN domain